MIIVTQTQQINSQEEMEMKSTKKVWVVLTKREGGQLFVPLAQLARKDKGQQTIVDYVRQAEVEHDVVSVRFKCA